MPEITQVAIKIHQFLGKSTKIWINLQKVDNFFMVNIPPIESLDATGRIKLCPLCWKPRWSANPSQTPICQCGAKKKMTPETIRKLEEAFAIGAKIGQACVYADITRETYYQWCKEYPELSDRFESLREKTPLKAKENIHRAIFSGSVSDSWRLLEKDPEYADQKKVHHTGNIEHLPPADSAAAAEDREIWEEALQKRRAARQRRALENDPAKIKEINKNNDTI